MGHPLKKLKPYEKVETLLKHQRIYTREYLESLLIKWEIKVDKKNNSNIIKMVINGIKNKNLLLYAIGRKGAMKS